MNQFQQHNHFTSQQSQQHYAQQQHQQALAAQSSHQAAAAASQGWNFNIGASEFVPKYVSSTKEDQTKNRKQQKITISIKQDYKRGAHDNIVVNNLYLNLGTRI